MNCDGIREVAYEYLKGWCAPELAAAIRAHLAACPACAAEHRNAESSLALLHALPEIEASPETWHRIQANLPRRRSAAPARTWIRLAAAASILVALGSFALILTMRRTGALPVDVGTSKAIPWKTPFLASHFTTIAIPDVGILKLNERTRLEFLDARTVVLESGEVFADIAPSGRGFELRSGDASIRVRGTRFGVTSPSTVYVVEGRVRVTTRTEEFDLGPNQAAVRTHAATRFVELGSGDYFQWLARHERPAVRLRLDPRDQTTITPGSPLKWHLTLETDSPVPLYLADLRAVSQYLSLDIDGTAVPLDPAGAVVKQASSGPNNLLRLDVTHPCVIECSVDPGLFRQKGRAAVRAYFVSGPGMPDRAWVGIAKSDLVHVEVR